MADVELLVEFMVIQQHAGPSRMGSEKSNWLFNHPSMHPKIVLTSFEPNPNPQSRIGLPTVIATSHLRSLPQTDNLNSTLSRLRVSCYVNWEVNALKCRGLESRWSSAFSHPGSRMTKKKSHLVSSSFGQMMLDVSFARFGPNAVSNQSLSAQYLLYPTTDY